MKDKLKKPTKYIIKTLKKYEGYLAIIATIISIVASLHQIFHEENTNKLIDVNIQKYAFIPAEFNNIISEKTFINKCIYTVEFINHGDTSINENDFLENIIIETEDKSSIYSTYYIVTDGARNYFKNKIIKENNTISLTPFLLNAKEKIKVIFVSSKNCSIHIQYRINETKCDLHVNSLDSNLNVIILRCLLLLFIFFIIYMITILSKNIQKMVI